MEKRFDMAQENCRDDEISLFDTHDLLHCGLFILVGASVLGLVVGIIVSSEMLAKYQASDLIDSGQVSTIMFDQTTGMRTCEVGAVSMCALDSKPIESLAVWFRCLGQPIQSRQLHSIRQANEHEQHHICITTRFA